MVESLTLDLAVLDLVRRYGHEVSTPEIARLAEMLKVPAFVVSQKVTAALSDPTIKKPERKKDFVQIREEPSGKPKKKKEPFRLIRGGKG